MKGRGDAPFCIGPWARKEAFHPIVATYEDEEQQRKGFCKATIARSLFTVSTSARGKRFPRDNGEIAREKARHEGTKEGRRRHRMALLISWGETAAQSHIFHLNRTIETLKHNVAVIFANVFCSEPILDRDARNCRRNDVLPSCSFEDLAETVGHGNGSRTEVLSPNNKEGDDGDPQTVFNVLDAMLKGSLERLKSMRENITSVKNSLVGYTMDTDYAVNVAIIRDLCLGGKLGTALWLRRKMIQKGFVPDVLTHNYLVNALCKSGELDKADWLIREMMEMGISPNCATYNSFIKGYCLDNNVDKALSIFSTMANSSIKPNIVTLNILVHALCKRGLLEDAKKLLQDILDDNENGRSDLVTSTILMDGHIKGGNMDHAFSIWNSMFQNNDLVAYNVLIHGFCLSRDTKLAFVYFCEMLKRGLLPDIFTYNTLVSGLCKEGKLDEASYVHGMMSSYGVAPDEISYRLIIRGLCIQGDVLKANEYLLHMLEKAIVPEPILWNLIIDGYGRHGDIDNALRIRDSMLSFGVVPNVFTYNAMIRAHLKAGNTSDAFILRKEMLLNAVMPDVVSYNLLIGAACNAGNISSALQLYDEMLKMGCEPDTVTHTELIRGYCLRGNINKAEELLAKLENSGLPIDHVPFQILIKKYCMMEEPQKAFGLYRKWLTWKERNSSL
ncbi:hypothetical protein Tsubulata_025875 [Turnera subulata]|uniref:Pentacotripeptide-repeat region of PRORP domain-containing protein n=1 Tax=Turnera subulata TaxID=218843 RepID=A0A9Q0JPK8_9ROSI|nr:hypothetical protein Tsubulata_025875 [Turnera subulata]